MNKKMTIIVALAAGVLLIGGGVWAFAAHQNNKKSEDTAMSDDAIHKDNEAMNKHSDAEMMDKYKASSDHGSYITLADYNANTGKYMDTKKIYYFHASWCPVCKPLEKEINASLDKIPADVTLIKTDFDNSTDLRQKYGVTYQHTFVQVDNHGNRITKWSATTLSDILAGIQR